MHGPRTPIVSTAIGEKGCSGVRLTYLATFLSSRSVSAATAPVLMGMMVTSMQSGQRDGEWGHVPRLHSASSPCEWY